MRAEAVKTKRGSKAWFTQKLQSVEALGGIKARELAVDRWSQIVWKDKNEAGFTGADALDTIFNLVSASAQLKDFSAKNRINNILYSDDEIRIKKLSQFNEGHR